MLYTNTMDYRHLDPRFTDFSPTTCVEAIKLLYRLKDNGEIHWDDLDLTFRRCARDLKNQEEFDHFVKWIVNPLNVPKGDSPDIFPADALYPSRPNQEEEKSLDPADWHAVSGQSS